MYRAYNKSERDVILILKKIFVKIRTSIKFISLAVLGTAIIGVAVAYVYKPMYSVTLNGEQIGYSENKSKLQNKINDYIKNGDNENVAFVEIDELPEYKLCLLKKDNKTNDDEIFEKVKALGTSYYRYYAITVDGEEKIYVSSSEEAETTIEQLKEKNTANKEGLSFVEKYETELQELSSVEIAVNKLYVEPVVEKKVTIAKNVGKVNTSTKISNDKVSLGISLIRPISGKITSRFGVRSSIRSGAHTGLDIAASKGTPIKAAASGTVTYAGYKGSYGNLVVISHGNGVQTYYGHCNSLSVSVGQSVVAGQVIATVGSTGNSTGPHLHLEIRVNGVARNPQNYLY